jgi:hypothetical protein
MVINHPQYTEDKEENEKRILQIYNDVMEQMGGEAIPSFIDITASVSSYNENIFYNIAVLQVMENGSYLDVDDIEELLEEETTSVMEWFSYNLEYCNLDDSIFELLHRNKLSFSVSEDDSQYEDLIRVDEVVRTLPEGGKEYDIIIADCQNIILPCFGIRDFFLQDNLILYRPGE